MINNDKLKLLHSIRGAAAFVVVICHSKFPFWSGGVAYLKEFPLSEWNAINFLLFGLDMLTSNGHTMVTLFFLLSGFFIAYSFHKNNWKYQDFYINRFLRIYIPYFASIIFTCLMMLLAHVITPELFSAQVFEREYNQGIFNAYQDLYTTSSWNALVFLKSTHSYIGYNYPYWSLLIEVFFYMTVPLVIFRKKMFLLLSAAAFVCSFFFEFLNPIWNYVFNHSFYFAIGMSLFQLIVVSNFKLRSGFVSKTLLSMLALSLFLTGQALSFSPILGKLDALFTVLGGCVLIYIILNYTISNNYVVRILKNMGKISYSMYLIHVPFFIFLYAIFVRYTELYYSYTRIYWIAVLLFIPVSYLFYYLVEEKSLNLIAVFKQNIELRKNKNNA